MQKIIEKLVDQNTLIIDALERLNLKLDRLIGTENDLGVVEKIEEKIDEANSTLDRNLTDMAFDIHSLLTEMEGATVTSSMYRLITAIEQIRT